MAGDKITCPSVNSETSRPLYDRAECEQAIRDVALRIIGLLETIKGDEARRRALRYAETLAPAAKGAES